MTTTEAEWDDEQQAIMLALAQYRASLCGQCGGNLAETTNPDNDPDNPDGGHRYVAGPPLECFQCKTLHRSEHNYAEHSDRTALIHVATLQQRRR